MPIPETAKTLQPQQVALLQKTFKNIIHEPWFARSVENERLFAGIVMKSYQDGLTDERVLSRYMRGIAQERFSKDIPH